MTASILCIVAAASLVLLLVIHIFKIHRAQKERDFTRTLETVLLPRETVKLVCPTEKGNWVLTSKRLLMEEKNGFHAVPIKNIKSLQGKNAAGNRTVSPAKMTKLIIKADKDYIVSNHFPQFSKLCEELQKELKKRKSK